MFRSRLFVAALLAALVAAPAAGQALPNIALAQVRYSTLKSTARPAGDLKGEIDAIDKALGDALRDGRVGEARRLLAKGITLLSNRPWTDLAEFASSLVVRADRVFVDPATPYTIRVEQIYAPSLELAAAPVAHVRLCQVAAPGQGGGARVGPIEKDFGSYQGLARDLRESPFIVDLDLAGVPDGRHIVEVVLLNGERTLGTCSLTIETRARLDARLASLEQGVAALPAVLAASVRADVRYPADYIRKVNRGRVEIGSFDADREVTAAEAALAALFGTLPLNLPKSAFHG